MNIALIILAAGNSSRLGEAKQLLQRGEQNMIEYTISQCIQSKLGAVYVVTGAYHKEISKYTQNAITLYNSNWQKGISSSIGFAMCSINQKNLDGVIVILSDQVYFDKTKLTEIAEIAYTDKNKIINCRYKQGMGPPTYFHKSLFSELEQISGDEGAKSLVVKYQSDCYSIDFDKGNIDIDEPKDLIHLNKL